MLFFMKGDERGQAWGSVMAPLLGPVTPCDTQDHVHRDIQPQDEPACNILSQHSNVYGAVSHGQFQ